MSSLSARPPGRSANIFINYRREDSAGHAGRLFDGLSSHFPGRLFMDVDTIAPGIDFVEAIEKAVGSCEVLIVVIGQNWLSLKNAAGQRRLDDPADFVRLELETALARNIRVIPVLVQDTPMPRAEDLPPSLARLARRNAIELSDVRWTYDVNRLAQTIQSVLGEKVSPPPPEGPAVAGPILSGAGREGRSPRIWLSVLAALVLVSTAVLATAGWLAKRESDPPPPVAVKNDASLGNPTAALAIAAVPGPPADARTAPAPIVPQPANPGTEGSAKTTHRPAAPAEPRERVAPPVEKPAGPQTAIRFPESAGEAAETRTAPEEPVGRTSVTSSPAEAAPLPEVTITSPKRGTKVGKRFTGQGLITGLGAGQRAFLCMKNRQGITYVRGELFPSADGHWSLEAESSHHDFEIFVVVSTTPEAAEILSDRGNQEHGFRSFPPKGASIVGPVVSLDRKREWMNL